MEKDVSLLVDLYELTMAQCYFSHKKKARATFDLFVRQLPPQRSYCVACGLSDILEYVKNVRFRESDLSYLKKINLFSRPFLAYLASFRFRGDLWAMPEGTVFFPQEPVLRVTAPIIDAQIIESFLLNTLNLQTMIASKASRVVAAAQDKGVFDFSLRRTHGQDAAVKGARASYIAGFQGTSNVLAGKRYGIPVVGTMAHAFVMAFKSEIESFMAYSREFPQKSVLLVDTYDTLRGVREAIEVGMELKKRGYGLLGIRLDSGDLVSLSKRARAMLDRAGLTQVKIFASGDLDETKIKNMLSRKAPIDYFGVGTRMGVSVDAPFLDVIYKISEVTDAKGRFLPTMKLSKAKVTYPGRKQVFRISDAQGKYREDVIALEKERIKGTPLLKKVIAQGKIRYAQPSLKRIRDSLRLALEKFPARLKRIDAQYRYPVTIAPGLKALTRALSNALSKRAP